MYISSALSLSILVFPYIYISSAIALQDLEADEAAEASENENNDEVGTTEQEEEVVTPGEEKSKYEVLN